MNQMTLTEWRAEARRRYGDAASRWEFQCVACGHKQSGRSIMERTPTLTAEEVVSRVYFSCEGRWVKGVGCDWTLGGLFKIHQREVIDEEGKSVPVFLFADEEPEPKKDGRPR